jgi:hypothetical protein
MPKPDPSSRHLNAGHHQTNKQAPVWLIPGPTPIPGFDVISCITTRHRWFTRIRLLGPHLAASMCDLFRDAHHDSLQLTQLTAVWDPRLYSDPGGPTSISGTALPSSDPGFYISTSQSNSGHTVLGTDQHQIVQRGRPARGPVGVGMGRVSRVSPGRFPMPLRRTGRAAFTASGSPQVTLGRRLLVCPTGWGYCCPGSDNV